MNQVHPNLVSPDGPPLKIYRHSAVSSSGIMIVSTPEGLLSMARLLEDASRKEGVAYTEEWPHQVLKLEATGPYKNDSRFALSFHVEGTRPSEEVIPRNRRFPGQVLSILIFALAILGIVKLAEYAAYLVAYLESLR